MEAGVEMSFLFAQQKISKNAATLGQLLQFQALSSIHPSVDALHVLLPQDIWEENTLNTLRTRLAEPRKFAVGR